MIKLKKPEPKTTEQASVTFRLPVERLDRFEAACKRAGVTVSEALRQLIDAYLARPK